MKKMSFLLSVLTAASLLAASSVRAQTSSFTVGYDFSGENGVNGTSYAATATDPSLTLGDATRGSGFSGLDPNNQYSGSYANGGVGVYPVKTNTYFATIADAESIGEYLTFTLTVANDPTSFVSLGQLSFGTGIQNGGGFTGLAYSLDGGTTFTSVMGTQGGGNGGSFSPAVGTYDLSGQTGLQDLLANSNVLFHLYDLSTRSAGYEVGNFTEANGSGLDVSIDGTTGPVTPEPGTWAMLGFGAGLLGLTLRRRALRA